MKNWYQLCNRWIACVVVLGMVACSGGTQQVQVPEEGAAQQPTGEPGDHNFQKTAIDWFQEHPNVSTGIVGGLILTPILITLGIINRKEIGDRAVLLFRKGPMVDIVATNHANSGTRVFLKSYRNPAVGDQVVFYDEDGNKTSKNPSQLDLRRLPFLAGHTWARHSDALNSLVLMQDKEVIYVQRDGERIARAWGFQVYNSELSVRQVLGDRVYRLKMGQVLESRVADASWYDPIVRDRNSYSILVANNQIQKKIEDEAKAVPPSTEDIPSVNLPPPESVVGLRDDEVKIKKPRVIEETAKIDATDFANLGALTVVEFANETIAQTALGNNIGNGRKWQKVHGAVKYRAMN